MKLFVRYLDINKKKLLGKPHNIVRHPDMDSSVFKEMWHTIKDLKQPWSGIVKTEKKMEIFIGFKL